MSLFDIYVGSILSYASECGVSTLLLTKIRF